MSVYVPKQGDIIALHLIHKLGMSKKDADRHWLSARIYSIEAQV